MEIGLGHYGEPLRVINPTIFKMLLDRGADPEGKTPVATGAYCNLEFCHRSALGLMPSFIKALEAKIYSTWSKLHCFLLAIFSVTKSFSLFVFWK